MDYNDIIVPLFYTIIKVRSKTDGNLQNRTFRNRKKDRFQYDFSKLGGIPHATMSYDADVTELLKEIKKLNAGVTDKSKKISINTVVLKIICEGLKAAPKMNCTLDFDRKLVRGTLYYHDNIDISMPMILHTGEMMTVNMHNMQNKSLSEMTAAINDTVRRANNTDMNEVMFEVSLDKTLKD